MSVLKSLAVAATILVVFSGQAPAQSLKQTFIDAYRNSKLLDQNRALLRATDESAAVALTSLRPVVSFVTSATAVDPVPFGGDQLSANASISASLTIFDAGNAKLGVEVAKQNILATRAALRGLEQQVLLNAASAFFNLRRATEVVALQTNNRALITRELDAAQDRFDVGEVTRTDVALAQARLAAVKSSLAAAQGGVARAREAYKVAVGKYPTRLGSAGALPNPAPSLNAAKAAARKASPAIIQAQHNAKVADLNVARSDTAFKPTVGVSGSVRADQDGDTSASVSLSLNQTLYSGGRNSALFRQAIAPQQASRAALLKSALIAEQGVGNAWADFGVAKSSLVASEEQIKASRLAFEGLREEASLGARTTLDVLDAEQDLLNAETTRAGAVNDRYIAAYALLASMGRLTVDQLNLGIVSYDPAAYYESVKSAPKRTKRGTQLDKVLKSLGKK